MGVARQAGQSRRTFGSFPTILLRFVLAIVISSVFLFDNTFQTVSANRTEIIGPPGSFHFGYSLAVLANGNIVITDPFFSSPEVHFAGAVYLYNGGTAELISTLTGSTWGDMVGSGGVVALSNGNFLVSSPYWNNGSLGRVGAVTWGSGENGVSGVVSADNSLVGADINFDISIYHLKLLSNGNYVINSPNWDNGAMLDVGAVTWGDGSRGMTGEISAANSLIGSNAGDMVGNGGIITLKNGNYVVSSKNWDNGTVIDAGAVTFGSRDTGIAGQISEANSLVGSTPGDQISSRGCLALTNGNYLVISPAWDNGAVQDAGAVTWGNGETGITGVVTSANSIVGSAIGDQVGSAGVIRLGLSYHEQDEYNEIGAVDSWATGSVGERAKFDSAMTANGNYVINSPFWDHGAVQDAGAVTWGNGDTGTTGIVSPANSVVGSSPLDQVGKHWVYTLTNGNYVISAPYWDNGSVVDAGAATWGNGFGGTVGEITASNSLVGSSDGDKVSSHFLAALQNGNYVVSSPYWQLEEGTASGAATWGDGSKGVTGVITVENSLIGKKGQADYIGSGGIYPLSNGNYVVSSPYWNSSDTASVGAVTWGNGNFGATGTVSADNSLVGSSENDRVGSGRITALTNGNYLVSSPTWDNEVAYDAGAITWSDGSKISTGMVSSANSLVGSSPDDRVGEHDPYLTSKVVVLKNGNYLVGSPLWDNGEIVDAGAVTWANGISGLSGTISAENSLVGSSTEDLVGDWTIYELSGGNYLVITYTWDNGALTDAGAVTVGSGTEGVKGAISIENSLVGSSADDRLGVSMLYDEWNPLFFKDDFVVYSPSWSSSTLNNAGAVTWLNQSGGIKGIITERNSVIGNLNEGGFNILYRYDPFYNQLVVSRRFESIVVLYQLEPDYPLYLPMITK